MGRRQVRPIVLPPEQCKLDQKMLRIQLDSGEQITTPRDPFQINSEELAKKIPYRFWGGIVYRIARTYLPSPSNRRTTRLSLPATTSPKIPHRNTIVIKEVNNEVTVEMR